MKHRYSKHVVSLVEVCTLYLIRKLRCILNTNELIIVYKTLIQPHIDYGIRLEVKMKKITIGGTEC